MGPPNVDSSMLEDLPDVCVWTCDTYENNFNNINPYAAGDWFWFEQYKMVQKTL